MNEGASSRAAGAVFHVGLAGILFPPLGFPVEWASAINAWRREPADPEEARWRRRIVGLALLDVLVAVGLILLLVRGGLSASAAPAPEEAPEASEPGVGALVLKMLVDLAPILVAAAVVILAARWRNRPKVAIWRGFFATLLAADAAAVAAAYGFRAITGTWTFTATLWALLGQTVGMAGMTLLCRWWLGPTEEPRVAGPRLSPVRATLRGVFYFVTGLPRVGIVLAALQLVVFGEVTRQTDPLQQIASAPMGPWRTALFLVVVAGLGPVAEEMLFRGYLLPRLAAQVGPDAALWVSTVVFALLHAHYGGYMPVIAVHGLVIGWARLRTGGLAAPIALHVLVNAVASAVFLLGS